MHAYGLALGSLLHLTSSSLHVKIYSIIFCVATTPWSSSTILSIFVTSSIILCFGLINPEEYHQLYCHIDFYLPFIVCMTHFIEWDCSHLSHLHRGVRVVSVASHPPLFCIIFTMVLVRKNTSELRSCIVNLRFKMNKLREHLIIIFMCVRETLL